MDLFESIKDLNNVNDDINEAKEPKKEDPYKSIRRDWGNVNPVTKVYKDKSKYDRKDKHKKDLRYENESLDSIDEGIFSKKDDRMPFDAVMASQEVIDSASGLSDALSALVKNDYVVASDKLESTKSAIERLKAAIRGEKKAEPLHESPDLDFFTRLEQKDREKEKKRKVSKEERQLNALFDRFTGLKGFYNGSNNKETLKELGRISNELTRIQSRLNKKKNGSLEEDFLSGPETEEGRRLYDLLDKVYDWDNEKSFNEAEIIEYDDGTMELDFYAGLTQKDREGIRNFIKSNGFQLRDVPSQKDHGHNEDWCTAFIIEPSNSKTESLNESHCAPDDSIIRKMYELACIHDPYDFSNDVSFEEFKSNIEEYFDPEECIEQTIDLRDNFLNDDEELVALANDIIDELESLKESVINESLTEGISREILGKAVDFADGIKHSQVDTKNGKIVLPFPLNSEEDLFRAGIGLGDWYKSNGFNVEVSHGDYEYMTKPAWTNYRGMQMSKPKKAYLRNRCILTITWDPSVVESLNEDTVEQGNSDEDKELNLLTGLVGEKLAKEIINFYNSLDEYRFSDLDFEEIYSDNTTKEDIIYSLEETKEELEDDEEIKKAEQLISSIRALCEDTVKQGNSWVNKGKEGTHGKFKTKKAADAQRRAMFARGFKGESLEEDFQVWGKAVDSKQELFRKFEDRTGLRAGNPIWVVKENTYDPATKTTKAEFKKAGVRLQKGNNGTWIPYFTDGDHGYDCEEVEITPNDIEIEQVTNEYNRQFPIIFLGYDAVEKLSKIVKDANDKRIATAKQQFASVQPTSYSKPIINSPLGERNARIKFKATVDDVEKRDYSYSNYWWGARDYDFYKMTDSNGNRLVVNVSSGKELPQDDEHEYIGTIQDAYIDKKTGDVVTRISRIRQLDESVERRGNLSLNESAFPEVSEKNKKRLAESLLKEEDCDEVIINIKEDGCIGKLHELRAKGYETAWAGEGQICMRKFEKEQIEEDFDNSELIYGKYELVPVEE